MDREAEGPGDCTTYALRPLALARHHIGDVRLTHV
jgi:hypothetical protein